jgi:uncharacterized membrane protein (DUF2068 family)
MRRPGAELTAGAPAPRRCARFARDDAAKIEHGCCSTPRMNAARGHRRDKLITLIGVLKLAKAVVLVAAAVSVLASLHDGVRSWLRELAAGSGREVVTSSIASLTSYGPHRIEAISFGLFAYAAMFTVEGVGLITGKLWAEWLTLIITASFVPIELYEVLEKVSTVKVVVLIVNILIGIYLIARRIHASHPRGVKGWLRDRFA